MIKANLAPLALGASVMLWGCSPPPKAEAPRVTASMPAPKPIFSINEMMVEIVDHPGELLWDVEKPGHQPKTDEAWYELQNHAVDLAGAGTLIQLGGTGPLDMGWAAQPEWRSSAQRLITAALAARQAAKNKDLNAVVRTNDQIVEACEACHAKFKPDIPTGKLFIHHRPGDHL